LFQCLPQNVGELVEAITAFFVARANSDFVEELNNKLKVSSGAVMACSITSTGSNESSSTWKTTDCSASLDPQIWSLPHQFPENRKKKIA
jgi:hypothetical protein